jgi:translocator protein
MQRCRCDGVSQSRCQCRPRNSRSLGVFYTGKEIAENADFGKLLGLPLSQWLSLLFVVFGSSFLGSFLDGGMNVATQQALDPNVVPGDPNWYAKLKKPAWNPPGFVFPIMWLLVSKPTQALALSKLLKSRDVMPWKTLAVYSAHLSLGDAWNKVFFGYQCTGKGAAVITVFFGALLTSAYLFFGVDPAAGKLLLPTCGWVFIASCLNWNIFLQN